VFSGWHIEDPLAISMNHSCNPNTYFIGRDCIALTDIKKEEEITFDYLNTEDRIVHQFECSCCGKEIKKDTTEKNL
jgi:SET domain-containing protein